MSCHVACGYYNSSCTACVFRVSLYCLKCLDYLLFYLPGNPPYLSCLGITHITPITARHHHTFQKSHNSTPRSQSMRCLWLLQAFGFILLQFFLTHPKCIVWCWVLLKLDMSCFWYLWETCPFLKRHKVGMYLVVRTEQVLGGETGRKGMRRNCNQNEKKY